MSTFLSLAVAFGAGMGLGLVYFGGLWLTVQRLGEANRPWLLLLSSFVGRLASVGAGFYLVTDGRWDRLVVCLIGFMAMRLLLVRRHRRPPARPRPTGVV